MSATLAPAHMGGMKKIRDLAELRSVTNQGPFELDTIHDHGTGPNTYLIPDALFERYGDNALNFGEDQRMAEFVEAALRDIPEIADDLSRAHAALARAEAEADRCMVHGPELSEALAELRAILGTDA